MAVKHFSFNPYKGESDKEVIESIHEQKQQTLRDWDNVIVESKKAKISDEDSLVHVVGRIIVKVDMDYKNSYTFANGTKIRLERKFNEFNRRITEPVNVLVISGEGIPKDAELLIDHNALHETNRINDYKNSFENEESDKIRYYSVPVYDSYAWRVKGKEWNPMPTFDFALRVFEPYKGFMVGIEPKQLKDTLYVTTGELKGNIVKTLVASDYQLIFQGDNGREDYLIRFRPFGDERQRMEPEAMAVLDELNEKLQQGELLLGYSPKDAKPITECVAVDSI